MKNTHHLQIDVAVVPRVDLQQQPHTAHALDSGVLRVHIAQVRHARATMAAALAGAPLNGIEYLATAPTSVPIWNGGQTFVGVKPRKTAPCKMYAGGRCKAGEACDFFHDPDALWTPERSKTWCWRYMAGVCVGQCKFRHPAHDEMAILMKHTPCVLPACPRIDCPRRHDDVDFDPEFCQKQPRMDAPRLVNMISPRDRAEHAAVLRARLQKRMPLRVEAHVNSDLDSAPASPTESASSSGIESLPTPMTSRADAVDDWRARDSDDRAIFPHTPGAVQTFAAATGELNGKGHARRQSVWVRKNENTGVNEMENQAGSQNWKGKEAVRGGVGHARSQSWAAFSLRTTFP